MKLYLKRMGIHRITCALTVVLTAILASMRPTAAQAPGLSDESQLSMGVSMPVTVPVTAPLPADKNALGRRTTIWRSYTPLDELRLNVSFTNESNAPLWILPAELRSAIQFAVQRDGTALPVSARWLDVLGYDRLPVPVFDAAALLESQKNIAFVVLLRRTDGDTFDANDYKVSMEMRNVRGAVRDSTGQVPNVRTPPDGQYEYIMRIQPPSNVAETVQRYLMEAEDRASRDEFTAAMNAYARAAEANPSDPSGMIGMAHMHMRLGQYREAIQLYEKTQRGGREDIMALFLARAYLGAGEDEKALQALRAGGAAESEIPGLIQDARDGLRADRSRFDRSPPPGR